MLRGLGLESPGFGFGFDFGVDYITAQTSISVQSSLFRDHWKIPKSLATLRRAAPRQYRVSCDAFMPPGGQEELPSTHDG